MKKRKVLWISMVMIGLIWASCFVKTEAKLRLNKVRVETRQGKTIVLKARGAAKKQKYQWRISGKSVKVLSKRKNKLRLQAVQVGKTVVIVKCGKKRKKCRIYVASSPVENSEEASQETGKEKHPAQESESADGNGTPGETEASRTFIITCRRIALGVKNQCIMDGQFVFLPQFMNGNLSVEEGNAWIAALDSEKAEMITRFVKESFYSDVLKEKMLKWVKGEQALQQEEKDEWNQEYCKAISEHRFSHGPEDPAGANTNITEYWVGPTECIPAERYDEWKKDSSLFFPSTSYKK